jgi:hypothetical protein
MSEDPNISFSANGRSLALQIKGRHLPDFDSEWENNTLDCSVLAEAESFRGRVFTMIRLDDLEELKQILLHLSREVGKEAEEEFTSLEAALQIEFSTTRIGGLNLAVSLWGGSALESRLAFVIEADQSYLPLWLEQITHALAQLDQ